MLARQPREGAAPAPEKLRAIYEQQLERVKEILECRKLPVLRLWYADCLRDSAAVAARVKKLLELPMNSSAMAACVDKLLYRQRK